MRALYGGLKVDISITNAGDNLSPRLDQRKNRSNRQHHLSIENPSSYAHNHGEDNEDNNNNGFESSITTYRAEGLSIGKDYLRIEGSHIPTMESISANDLVVESIIGGGVSSVVKLARYEPRKRNSTLNEDVDVKEDSKRNDQHHVLDMQNSRPNKAAPIYYALKIFPLCRDVNRNDARTCNYHNYLAQSDGTGNDDDSFLNVMRRQNKQQQRSMLIQEIKTLCVLQCESLVHMVGAFYDAGASVTMILEYMDQGSLSHLLGFDSTPREDDTRSHICYENDVCIDGMGSPMLIPSRQSTHQSPFGLCDTILPRSQRKRIMVPEAALASIAYQTLWGLAYLHFENILHRDIKPANVLVHSSGKVKLGDLGIAGRAACGNSVDINDNNSTLLEMSQSGLNHTVIGTTQYMSPERVLDRAYGTPSDIWSLGLVLLECATGGLSPFLLYTENGDDNSYGISMGSDKSSRRGVAHRKGVRSVIELAMILEDFSIDDVLNKLAKRSQASEEIENST